MSFGQTLSKLQEHLQQDHPLAPTEPEEHQPLLEKGHSPSESSKAVPLHFQHVRGQTQWKFQKSQILHKVLNVIAVNMESMGRCLDFCELMPMGQEFQH